MVFRSVSTSAVSPPCERWECSRCGYHNEDFRTKCRICGNLT